MRVDEAYALAGQAVEVRRDAGRQAAREAGRVVVHVVRCDEQHVEARRGGQRHEWQEGEQ
jgi:hypothetical protein